MTSAIDLEILDLRHFSGAQLKPLLETEARLWNERLRWDFRASAELLLQYLNSKLLPGYVALEQGRIRGYVFFVYEGAKAVIGDVFAAPSPGGAISARAIERRLLDHLVELLQHSPGIDRIESQLLLHSHPMHEEALEQAGFRTYERLFMELELTPEFPPAGPHPALAGNLELRSWRDGDLNPAGRLIAEAYAGHLDSLINDQYLSTAGALRFLHNIVRFPGCGIFDSESTRVLTFRGGEGMAGLLLCSRVRDDVGHVTQICVAPRHRRKGLGAWLLNDCMRHLQRRKFRALTLTVTRENANAVALYRRQGFATRHSFDAMVWERPRPGRAGPFTGG
jgi:GNAT superfamily N-acetyltransferase